MTIFSLHSLTICISHSMAICILHSMTICILHSTTICILHHSMTICIVHSDQCGDMGTVNPGSHIDTTGNETGNKSTALNKLWCYETRTIVNSNTIDI